MRSPKDMSPEAVAWWMRGFDTLPDQAAAVIALVEAKVLAALIYRDDPTLTRSQILARVMGWEV